MAIEESGGVAPQRAINVDFVRDSADALLLLYHQAGLQKDQAIAIENLHAVQNTNLHTDRGIFGACYRVANAIRPFLERVPDAPKRALLSTAYICYEYCSRQSPKFADAFRWVQNQLPNGPLSENEIFQVFHEFIDGAPPLQPERETTGSKDIPDVDLATSREIGPTEGAPGRRFNAPRPPSMRERLEATLERFPLAPVGTNLDDNHLALVGFREFLSRILAEGDSGRTFVDFKRLEEDLTQLEPRLRRFADTDNPREIQDRAKISREFASYIDFAGASADEHTCSRLGWLLSAFWNTRLSRLWSNNRPYAVVDFLGYLTVVQAELRYNDSEFLLLLRVSYSISRIATCDALLPLQFLNTGDVSDWLRNAVGTILACTGPGRVPPSRVSYDSRLENDDRKDYAKRLLTLWRSDAERAAAATILLEMGAWDASRSKRILGQVFPRESPELELWSGIIDRMASHARRVRVVRPNPWQPGSEKLLTVEREAIAVLAADVIDRNYKVLVLLR